MRVLASSGTIGGSLSHEFHLPAPCGQDYIHYCQSCRSGDNEEVYSSLGVDCSSHHCQTCGITMDKIRTVEIAHSFILGQKYSQPLEATFLDSSGQQKFLEMSCYGIGTSRLLAAAVELLSSDKFIRWPEVIAPFTLAIIPPKSGSKEELAGGAAFTQDFAHHLLTTFPTLRGDILIDDRPLTVGKRLEETQRLGIPLIFVGAKVNRMMLI